MEEVLNDYGCFDLAALLLLDELATRSFSEGKPALTLESYYGKLTAFLTLAPDVSRALGRFDNREGDTDDRRSVHNMINLLEDMGCERFVVEFHSILDSYENEGNWRLAATYARRVRDGFNGFHSRILAAKKKKSEAPAVDGALLLADAIFALDDEEAGRKPIVLAVDDSPVILRSVSSVLRGEFKVLTLSKPAEIDKILQKQKPDLFLLDYRMPEISGFDLIPIIRSYKEHKETPILFLTSEGTIDNLTTAIALGARDFIVKPFKPETLLEKVGKNIR